VAANLNLEATIASNGQVFPGWESIEIWREFTAPFSYMKFRASEQTDGGTVPLSALSLDVGDPVDGYLCGQKVISGYVMTRQVAADKQTHAVEIIVASLTQSLEAGTVVGKPGQYINQTLMQIASSAAGLAGVSVRMVGDTSGANMPFPRISEHIGEQIIDFIRRIANWRNMHLTDDENGNLVLARGKTSGQTIAQLQEGRNLESVRMVKNYQFAADPLVFQSQTYGTDTTNGTDASQNAISKSNPSYTGPKRPQVILGDNSGNKSEAAMAFNQTQNNLNLAMWEVVGTVPGWQMDDGSLWILKCFGAAAAGPVPVTIYSPMLQPKNPNITNLFVKGVKHLQDNEGGTRTEVTACLQAALSQGALETGDAPYGGGSSVFANVPTIPATNQPGGPGTAR
jgi:prophage tail gpP-like protein